MTGALYEHCSSLDNGPGARRSDKPPYQRPESRRIRGCFELR